MESIIDLAAILQHPAWMKKTPGHNGTPHLTSSIWEIASLNQLNEKREKGAKEGKKGDTFQGFSERKKTFSHVLLFQCCSYQGNSTMNKLKKRKTVKSYSFTAFSLRLWLQFSAWRWRVLSVWACLCVRGVYVRVCDGWYSTVFSPSLT